MVALIKHTQEKHDKKEIQAVYTAVNIRLFCFVFLHSYFSWLLMIVISYSSGQLDGSMAFLAACPYIDLAIMML